MDFSTEIKVNNRNAVSRKVTENIPFDKLLSSDDPLIINGIHSVSSSIRLMKDLKNVLWIEPNKICTGRMQRYIDESFSNIRVINTFELSRYLINDVSLKDYSVIVLNNMQERSIYWELFFGNMKVVEYRRKSMNLSQLKIVIFAQSVPTEKLVSLFSKSTIYTLNNDFSGQTLTIDKDLANGVVVYVESVCQILSAIFIGNNDGKKAVDASIISRTTSEEKINVLVFLASFQDMSFLYKWISKTMLNMRNIQVLKVDNELGFSCCEKPSDSSSVIVLANCADKSIFDNLSVEFHYVIDSGFVTISRWNNVAHTDIGYTVRIDFSEYLLRSSHALKNCKNLQLYSSSGLKSKLDDNVFGTDRIMIDLTDYVFCQLSVCRQTDCITSSAWYCLYRNQLESAVTNLMNAGLIKRVTNSQQHSNENEYKTIVSVLKNYDLTELGGKCRSMVDFDCRDALVLVRSLDDGLFGSCFTILCILTVADSLFSENFSEKHIEKLKQFYHGNDDIEFLLILYRHIFKLSTDERNSEFKRLSVNKGSIIRAAKNRSAIKGRLSQNACNAAKANYDGFNRCFVAAYPFQIAKYSSDLKVYLRGGNPKYRLQIDQYSFANNADTPPPYVFYYSAFSKDNVVYMKYVSPITEEIWVEHYPL